MRRLFQQVCIAGICLALILPSVAVAQDAGDQSGGGQIFLPIVVGNGAQLTTTEAATIETGAELSAAASRYTPAVRRMVV